MSMQIEREPRAGRFWTIAFVGLVLAVALVMGKSSITPILDISSFPWPWTASADGASPPAAAPVDAGPCGEVTGVITMAICDHFAEEGGGIQRFEDAAKVPTEDAAIGGFVVIGGAGRIGSGREIVDGGEVILLTEADVDTSAGWVRAAISLKEQVVAEEPQPGGDSALASAIRDALGVSEIWFYDASYGEAPEPVAGGTFEVRGVGRWPLEEPMTVEAGGVAWLLTPYAEDGGSTYFEIEAG